jgi:nitrite reductase/ring-hydroxylating ferredoxin subunit
LDWRPGEFLTPDKSKILCTMHGAEFDIKSGICGTTPCPGGELAKVPIELRDGVLYIAES